MRLVSGDPELQMAAFDEITATATVWAEDAVAAFKVSDNPFLIAERLPVIGVSCIYPLRKILTSDSRPELKILSAIVLFKLGDMYGIGEIMNEIRTVGPYACVAVGLTSFNRIEDISAAILEGIKKINIADVDLMVAYVLAVQKLGLDLPGEVAMALKSDGVPWQVASLFR